MAERAAAAGSSIDAGTTPFEQRLGELVPMDSKFTDSDGSTHPLSEYFGRRPVVLSLGYYQCPNLCGIVQNATIDALAALAFRPANDYTYLFVSIDPSETPRLADASKRAYSRQYGKEGTEQGWHFLTGTEQNIRAIADAVGFTYRYDPNLAQYAHPSGIVVLTPEGEVSKYLYGIEYDPTDLRLALVEAGSGEIGSPVDQLLLLCARYNPITGQYSFVIDRSLKAACLLSVMVLGGYIGRMAWKERANQKGRGDR